MIGAAFDHLIVAAATLEQGDAYIEARTGVRPLRGGKHVAMGTHNAVLRLGPRTYLEVIAIDSDAPAPKRARWFELDRPAMQASLEASPRLVAWAARCTDIDAARHRMHGARIDQAGGARGVDVGTARSPCDQAR